MSAADGGVRGHARRDGRRSNVRTVTSLLNEDGTWADSVHFQVPEVARMDKEEYFRSYDGYYRANGIVVPRFNEEELRTQFGRYESLQYPSSFDAAQHGWKVSKAFQIAGEYSWRVTTPDERLYSRPADGAIAMPLSHFKAGLRPRPHRFLIALFKQEFRCSPAQFTPNSIRVILWFIAACNRLRRQPTFKAFFSLFHVKASRKDPFYELVQYGTNTRVGIAIDGYHPLNKPRCMKNWWNEFVMLLGGEWSYMPGFSVDCSSTYKVPPSLQTREVLDGLRELVTVFGESWSASKFHRVSDLKQHNCECMCCGYVSYCCEVLSGVCFCTVVLYVVLPAILFGIACSYVSGCCLFVA